MLIYNRTIFYLGCGALGNVPNGHWNYSGDSAYLVCKPGYSPGGTTTVQCGENGEWGIIVAICANDGTLFIMLSPKYCKPQKLTLSFDIPYTGLFWWGINFGVFFAVSL